MLQAFWDQRLENKEDWQIKSLDKFSDNTCKENCRQVHTASVTNIFREKTGFILYL